MNKITLLFITLIFVTFSNLYSQNIPLSNEVSYYFEQQNIREQDFHSTIKPFRQISAKTLKDTSFYSINNTRKDKFFQKFYEHNLIENEKNTLSLNPIFSSILNFDKTGKKILPDFKAGLSFKGNHFKNKLFYNADIFFGNLKLSDFQRVFTDSFSILAGHGKYLSKSETGTVNYLCTGFELTYKPANYIDFSIGNGRQFLGNGYRSLFLSDNSGSYPYFKTEVTIKKIKYLWLVAKISDFNIISGSKFYESPEDKFLSTHYLSLNITKNINFNFFEAIISSPNDEKGRFGINPHYLNPVIFYRPVEFATGSDGNALIGAGLNIKIFNEYILYSQFILDEFIFAHIKARDRWWGNKIGVQAGAKAYNCFGIKNLYAQGEINAVRPYTYTHQKSNFNYGNNRQPLAHPIGANFYEILGILRYDASKISYQAKFILAQTGLDTDTMSYGQDIYKSYRLRVNSAEYKIADGDKYVFFYSEFKTSYKLSTDNRFRFEAGFAIRKLFKNISDTGDFYIFAGFSFKIYDKDYFL